MTTVNITICLNIVICVLSSIAQILTCRIGNFPLSFMINYLSLLGLLSLMIWSIVIIFIKWKTNRWRTFLPIVTFIISVTLSFYVSEHGMDYVLRNTLQRPDTFFTHTVNEEFTRIAEELLDKDFKLIEIRTNQPFQITMLSGASVRQIPKDATDFIIKYNLRRVEVDDRQKIVVFGYYRPRRMFEYIYARSVLKEPLDMSPEITEADIVCWENLASIINQASTVSKADKAQHNLEPTIAYSNLVTSLGYDFLTKVRMYRSSSEFTADNKKLILEALNKQRQVSSRLAENPKVRYEKDDFGNWLVIGNGYKISNGFWEVKLIDQLLKEGILSRIDKDGHLKIRDNLSETDQRKVEWLHVGLMDFSYGNLIRKQQYPFSKQLGNQWYYNSL